MNKVIAKHLRSGLSFLIALCLIFSSPLTALAATSSTSCADPAAAQEMVDDAEYYVTNSQKVVNIIVDNLIDGKYADLFSGSATSDFVKSVAISKIKEKLDSNEDLMIRIGFEPTDENKEKLAEEIYYVGCIYYDELNVNGGTRESANYLSLMEVICFCLVETKGYSDADARAQAEVYYDVYQVLTSDSEAAALEYAATLIGNPHTYDAPVWTWAEDYSAASAAYTCSVCGHAETVAATVTTDVVSAGCTQDGTTTYTATAVLDSYTHTDTQTITTSATGHNYGAAVWTWASDYSSATVSQTCSNCNDVIQAEGTITKNATEPTCDTDGSVVYNAVASLNGVEYTDTQTEVLPAGHTFGEPSWVWAEDYSSASALFQCFVCQTEQTVAAEITVQTVEATCTADGSSTYTASASVNGTIYTDTKNQILPSSGHHYGEVVWTWSQDYTEATVSKSCLNCKDVMEAEGVITVSTEEASCSTAGSNTYTATATLDGVDYSDTAVETIAAKGHTYEDPIWTWSEDCSEASANFICTVCKEEVTLEAEVTTKITEGNCLTEGTATHTATVTLAGKKYTDIKTTPTEITGHTYGEPTWTWAEDYSAATAEFTCTVCDEKLESMEATVTHSTEDGNCEKDTVTTYTATVQLNDVVYTDTKVVTTEGSHNYVDGVCTVCGDCLVQRISGADRIETALAVAKELKVALGVEKFDSIILAAGGSGSDQTKFADALSGSYLASAKKAPILLYTKGELSSKNIAFIEENLSDNGTIYLLGGNVSIPAEVEDSLNASGYTTKRLGGADRYQTNLIILDEAGISSADEILVAGGQAFADSLSASATGLPIMLVNGTKTSLTNAQIEFLQSLNGKKVTILGGAAAVSADLEAAIEAAIGGEADRIYGDTREHTSAKIAKRYFSDAEFALIAYSKMYPDGLAGGVLANALHAPLLLTKAGSESIANDYIAETGIEAGYVLGGTAVMTDDTARAVFGLDEDAVISQK